MEESPAYIMFTSGSTGFPKGALMSHNNLLNFIQWGKETFEVTEDDIFTNANPVYFDNSVFDFYTSIFNGCTLVPLSHDLVKNAGRSCEGYQCIWLYNLVFRTVAISLFVNDKSLSQKMILKL